MKEKESVRVKLNADSAFSNVAAKFCQCLSLIVSKLSTRDRNQNLGKIKHIKKLAKPFMDSLVPSVLRGLAMINQLLTVSLVVEKL